MTSVPALCTPENTQAFIERQWSRLEQGEGLALALADAATNKAIGHLYLGVRPQPGVVGIGYWLVPDARGRGLAARAVSLLTAWSFATAGAARVEAWVVPENEPSLRTLASIGFQREGLLRSFLTLGLERSDVVVWSRLSSDD